MTRPVRMMLTDRVQVFGLPVEIDWPAGTVVVVENRNGNAVTVTGPDGLRCTLPARLLEPTETQEHARRAKLAATTTIAEIRLPTGGLIEVERGPDGYNLAGRLSLFGCDEFSTLPLHAADDDDAITQADRMVRARWDAAGAT